MSADPDPGAELERLRAALHVPDAPPGAADAGRTIHDDQYFDGRHDDFLLSVSIVDRPSWSASVLRVLPTSSG